MLAVSVEFCFVVWGVGRLVDTGVSDGRPPDSPAPPIGLAAGRLAVPGLLRRGLPPILTGALVTACGTLVMVAGDGAAAATTALLVAGFGVAPFYPVLLAALMAVPRLPPGRAASVATLASGTAILAAPAVLGLLGQAWGLRGAFLATVPILIAVVLVARPASD